MTKRTAKLERRTKETSVRLELNLDGKGRADVDTSLPFLDHMLELLARHSGFDVRLKARGDTHIDEHHLVEDIGIVLGQVLSRALGSKRGIARYGQALRPGRAGKALTPMDETLSYVALDLSGRSAFVWKVKFHLQNKAPFPFELLEHFFESLAFNAKMNLHMRLLDGRNNHHIAESLFKGLARALREATALNFRRSGVPSTKGRL